MQQNHIRDKNDIVNPELNTDNNPNNGEKNNNQGRISSVQKALPVTGENEKMTMISIIFGSIFLLVGLIVSIFRFKKWTNIK